MSKANKNKQQFTIPFSSSVLPRPATEKEKQGQVRVELENGKSGVMTAGTVESLLKGMRSSGIDVTNKSLMDSSGRLLSTKTKVVAGEKYRLKYTKTAGESSSGSSALVVQSIQNKVLLENILKELKEINTRLVKLESGQQQCLQNVKTTKPIFSVEKTEYMHTLKSKLGAVFLRSLRREVDDETLQSLATQAMDRDANDPEKLDAVLRWLKKKFSEYRVDERRKVLGLNPYGKFPERKTETVARDMIGTLKAPMSRDIEKCYLKNLTLLKKFVREESPRAREEGKMYVQFREWLEYRFGESGEPCPAEWQTILEDDGTSHTDEESPVDSDPTQLSP